MVPKTSPWTMHLLDCAVSSMAAWYGCGLALTHKFSLCTAVLVGAVVGVVFYLVFLLIVGFCLALARVYYRCHPEKRPRDEDVGNFLPGPGSYRGSSDDNWGR